MNMGREPTDGTPQAASQPRRVRQRAAATAIEALARRLRATIARQEATIEHLAAQLDLAISTASSPADALDRYRGSLAAQVADCVVASVPQLSRLLASGAEGCAHVDRLRRNVAMRPDRRRHKSSTPYAAMSPKQLRTEQRSLPPLAIEVAAAAACASDSNSVSCCLDGMSESSESKLTSTNLAKHSDAMASDIDGGIAEAEAFTADSAEDSADYSADYSADECRFYGMFLVCCSCVHMPAEAPALAAIVTEDAFARVQGVQGVPQARQARVQGVPPDLGS